MFFFYLLLNGECLQVLLHAQYSNLYQYFVIHINVILNNY